MAFIKIEEINKIRQEADIVDIIADYLPLQKKGANYVAVCPFHDDHKPSLFVSKEKQIFNCFTCNTGGNIFAFLMKYENISFVEAVDIVAKKIGYNIKIDTSNKNDLKYKKEYELYDFVTKFYINNLNTKEGIDAKKYLKKRGIDESVIREFKIGLSLSKNDSLSKVLLSKNYSVDYLDEMGLINKYEDNVFDKYTNRIMIPIEDLSGNIVGFTGRIYHDEDSAKYINTKETKIFKKSEILFNYHNARNTIKSEKKLIIVEGNMDAIKLSANNIKNVIALMGLNLSKIQIDTIKKLRVPVVLMLDNDTAGLDATLKLGQILIDNKIDVEVIRFSDGKDPDEYILKYGLENFKKILNKPIKFIDFKIDSLKDNKNLNSIEDLTKFIRESLEVLKNRDILEKEIFINKLASEYNIDANILKKELNIKKEEKKEEKINSNTNIKVSKYDKAVSKILYAMMNDKKYISIYKNKVGYFADKTDRIIASEIIYYNNEHNNINIADFVSFIMTNSEIYDKVIKIINQNENFEVNDEVINNCVDVLLKERNKLEIEELKRKIKNEKDENVKVELLQKIASLKKGSVNDERN